MSEFRIFMATLVISRIKEISEEEQLAIRSLPEFVVRHYHGSFKNVCWADELVRDNENDESAIETGMIFMLELSKMIRSRGIEARDDILDAAQEFILVPPAVRSERLKILIDEATQVTEELNDEQE